MQIQTDKTKLETLTEYVKQLDFQVCYTNKENEVSYVDYDKKIIMITTRQKKEYQLYDLLHEVGHIRLDTAKDFDIIEKRTKHSYVFHSFSKPSLTYKIQVLQEEIDAWNLGEKLAMTLNIQIDPRKFAQHKSKRIGSYVQWINKQKKTL